MKKAAGGYLRLLYIFKHYLIVPPVLRMNYATTNY